jgi:hypothetical protein
MTMPPHIESDARPEPADWLEQALAADAAQHRDAYIDDDGFTTRVMQVLPAPAAMPRWRKPALVALWIVAALALLAALPGAALDVAREAFRLASARPFSLSEVAVVIVALACVTWVAAAFALRRE